MGVMPDAEDEHTAEYSGVSECDDEEIGMAKLQRVENSPEVPQRTGVQWIGATKNVGIAQAQGR